MTGSVAHAARETLIAGLRNLHAVERQAVSTYEPQAERLDAYPEFQRELRAHIDRCRRHDKSLDILLRRLDASTSILKSTVMAALGAGQAAWQGVADDSVVKALLADAMFQKFKVASYRSAIVLAGLADAQEVVPELEAALADEEAMGAWLDDHLAPITEAYVRHEADQAQAKESEDAKPSALDRSSEKDATV
jgi:ferritin-like metal-binding protein YciE